MVESIYFLKPAWCGTHFAGLWPEQGFQPVTRATALRRWFVTPALGQIPAEGVSIEVARERAGLISNTHYNLSLELRPKAARMPGHVVLEFDLSRVVNPLPLDFRNGSSRNLKVNGSAAELRES